MQTATAPTSRGVASAAPTAGPRRSAGFGFSGARCAAPARASAAAAGIRAGAAAPRAAARVEALVASSSARRNASRSVSGVPLSSRALGVSSASLALTSSKSSPSSSSSVVARAVRSSPRSLAGGNTLVLGSGGREHALAWRLAQSPSAGTVFIAPGNAGTRLEDGIVTVSDLNPSDHSTLIEFCRRNDVRLVVPGPEAYLVEGVSDALEGAGIVSFGPSKSAAALEGSKAFMKDLVARAGIPTAGHRTFDGVAELEAAERYIDARAAEGVRVVVKTSGLAAGKGVIVAADAAEAKAAAREMLLESSFGEAGSKIVIEDFLEGEECSVFALVDGTKVLPLAGAQDHKAVGEGDTGPNTGGMGTYSPAPVLTPDVEARVLRELVEPTARAMVEAGRPFRGVLFAGVMVSPSGDPLLLEHNVRFGDPECQSLMLRLRSPLDEVLRGLLDGSLVGQEGAKHVEWTPQAALTVVLAAKGYPGAYAKGLPIRNLDMVHAASPTAKVFHAATIPGPEPGTVLSAGGRVLAVSALGDTVSEAQKNAYAAVDAIDFPEGFCRRDIGWRAVQREQRANGNQTA